MTEYEIIPTDMEEIKKDIKKAVSYLKKRRIDFKWSIAELSKRSGVSVGVISDLENKTKKMPSVANFIALARTLRMTEKFALPLMTECGKDFPYEQIQDSILSIITDNLRDYGIHDRDSIDFIVNTIEFVKSRRKN